MKVLLFFVLGAIIGAAYGQTVASGFQYISDHTPRLLMLDTIELFNYADAETQSFVAEFKGAEFQRNLQIIKDSPEYREIMASLLSQDVPAEDTIMLYFDFIGNLPSLSSGGFLGGTAEMWNRLRTLLQESEFLVAVANQKENNQPFREYIELMGQSRDKFQTVRYLEATQYVFGVLQRHHFDTEYILELIMGLFGWQ